MISGHWFLFPGLWSLVYGLWSLFPGPWSLVSVCSVAQVCKFLTMREYKWESVKNKTSLGGKFKRALLQFTPESWTHARWLDPASSYMRLIAVTLFMMIWQVVELNTFFIKHIWPMPAEHPICVARILFTGLMAAPSTRQFYTYITDPQCKRVGTQCWVFIMITLSELVLVTKFGSDLFSPLQLKLMLVWVVLLVVVACLGLAASIKFWRWRHSGKVAGGSEGQGVPVEEEEEGEMVARYLQGSEEAKGGKGRRRKIKARAD